MPITGADGRIWKRDGGCGAYKVGNSRAGWEKGEKELQLRLAPVRPFFPTGSDSEIRRAEDKRLTAPKEKFSFVWQLSLEAPAKYFSNIPIDQ